MGSSAGAAAAGVAARAIPNEPAAIRASAANRARRHFRLIEIVAGREQIAALSCFFSVNLASANRCSFLHYFDCIDTASAGGCSIAVSRLALSVSEGIFQ